MGTGLPHAIGTQIADPSRKLILICGDGSFPFNMQELQTILTNALPIKIIIISNGGYLSIQGTQNQFLEGRHFGSAPTGGLDTPNFKKISAAFNLRYWEIETKADLDAKLWKFLDLPECAILEIHIAPGQEIFPRTAFKKLSDGKYSPLPLSEMHPPKNVPGFASSKSTQ
jgi:acetolactate synthase-1/2/3 large subunit